jgi:hypothetical protein
MSKAKELDQFYTKPSIAEYCVEVLSKYYPFEAFTHIVEPAAGTGAFYNLLPQEKRIGLDIDPKIDVEQSDFLNEYKYPYEDKGRVLVLTNPPYGTNSTTAVAFFKKAASFADVIGYLIPIQWKRYSLQNRLPKDWNLIYTEDLPKDSFIFNEQSYGVSTCFQIWTKHKYYPDLRTRTKPITSHPDFEFIKDPSKADFLLVVCGRRNQYIHETDSKLSKWTVERIKCNKSGVREVFESINWDKYGEQSTGTMWINKEMIVKEYTNAINKL